MAKPNFLRNLRTARNYLLHRAKVDHPTLEPESVENQFHGAAMWLTPASVKGFDVKDFQDLPPERQSELAENVDRFLQVAQDVPADRSASREQIELAMPPLLKIIEILDTYLHSEGEFEKIRRVLTEAPLPERVLNWNFEIGNDSTGDPAIRFWIFVDDATAESDKELASLSYEAFKVVHKVLRDNAIERWPYVDLRTVSEQMAVWSASR